VSRSLVLALVLTVSCASIQDWLLKPVDPPGAQEEAQAAPVAPGAPRPTTRADILLGIMGSLGRATGVLAPVMGVFETVGSAAIGNAYRLRQGGATG